MSIEADKQESNLKSITEKYKEKLKPQYSGDAETIAEYLIIVRRSKRGKYFKYAYLPIMAAGLLGILLLLSMIYHHKQPIVLMMGAASLVIGIVILLVYVIHGRFILNLFKKQQEVKCPKCEGYIPLYQWQCPQCAKVHADRHIFLNCDGCEMRVGKLLKNLQFIRCINENCSYDLYFYEPYEGGFNELSFRGEE